MTSNTSGFTPSRRTLVKGAAWSVPVVAVAGTAPALAASLRKDPGINGWVNNTPRGGLCTYSLEVNSRAGGTGPDGAPFGLYIYDTNDDDTITGASLTYWIEGAPSSVTWTTYRDHSDCWSGPEHVGTEVKPDGFTYTGFRWTYTCPIDPTDRTMGADGVERVFLGHFHVRSSAFRTPNCEAPTYWTQRAITINGEILTFQRRNGYRGTYPRGNNRQTEAQAGPVDTAELDAQIGELDVRIADLDAQVNAAQEGTAPAPAALGADDAETTSAPGEPEPNASESASPDVAGLQSARAQLLEEKTVLEQERAAMLATAEEAPTAEQLAIELPS